MNRWGIAALSLVLILIFGAGCAGKKAAFPPAQPVGFVAANGDRVVYLNWAGGAEADLAGYNVFRSEKAGGPYRQINDQLVSDFFFWDRNVENGKTYYYAIEAVNTGGAKSKMSNEDSATPGEVAVISPFDGEELAFLPVNFIWEPYVGAKCYRVRVESEAGNLMWETTCTEAALTYGETQQLNPYVSVKKASKAKTDAAPLRPSSLYRVTVFAYSEETASEGSLIGQSKACTFRTPPEM